MLTCQKCRALLEPGTKSCPYCGTDQRHQLAPTESQDAAATTRFGLWVLGINIAVFLLMLALDPAKSDRAGSLQPSSAAFIMFGWAHAGLVHGCSQYWRLLASMFLHADLLHLAMNSIALFYLTPVAARTFGKNRTAFIYIGAGLVGAAASHLAGNSGLGASGALCGLISASAVYGWRRGGMAGKALTRGMITWALLICLFGFMPNTRIDNWAHLGGFLGGALLGYAGAAVRARGSRADRVWSALAQAAIVGAVLVAALFWIPSLRRGLERTDVLDYYRLAARTLDRIEASAAPGTDVALPEEFDDGPAHSEAVRDAVRAALAAAKRKSAGTAGAVAAGRRTLHEWGLSLFCSHGLSQKDLT